jgi:hypothetical protein
MYGDLETIESYWMRAEWERITADKKITGRPCFLYAAHLTASAVGAATAVVRDGTETAAEAVINLAALTSSFDTRNFDPPIYLKKGLYVDVGDNVTSVLVHFLPLREKKE